MKKPEFKTIVVSALVIVGCIAVMVAMSGCDPKQPVIPQPVFSNKHEVRFEFRVYDHGNVMADRASVSLAIDDGSSTHTIDVGPIFSYNVNFEAGEKITRTFTATLTDAKFPNQIECRVLLDGSEVSKTVGAVKRGESSATTTCSYE